MGIVHTPGMASELLGEMAPLLAAEGIDLDNLDGTDLGAVNAALARATARHNLELFTPVGARRTGALGVLHRFSDAIAANDMPRARSVLASIAPDPSGDIPAISHVIGVSLGLLDDWHADSTLRSALAKTRLPAWEKRSRAAGTDVLALARKGRAFDTLDGLHRRHSGLAIFEGAALVVAASLSARADFEGVSVADLSTKLLGPTTSSTPGSSFRRSPGVTEPRPVNGTRKRSGRPIRRLVPAADRVVLAEFERWLQKEASIGVDIDDQRSMLEALFEMTRKAHLDLHDPADIDAIIDLVFETGDDGDDGDDDLIDDALDALHDYVHFRLETSSDIAGWDEAHELVEAALDEPPAGMQLLDQAIEAAHQLPAEERRQALAGTPIAAAVGELLSWIGSGRAISSTGSIRRADIATVAGMLGISAIGVSKRPVDASGPTIHALSMRDVPLLAAWWESLRVADLIELSVTRVRVGELAAEWRSESLPPEELAEMLVGVFVAQLLMHERASWGLLVTEEVIGRLVVALSSGVIGDDHEQTPIIDIGVDRVWGELQRAGIVQGFSVPPALRAAVARGTILGMALLGAEEHGG